MRKERAVFYSKSPDKQRARAQKTLIRRIRNSRVHSADSGVQVLKREQDRSCSRKRSKMNSLVGNSNNKQVMNHVHDESAMPSMPFLNE